MVYLVYFMRWTLFYNLFQQRSLLPPLNPRHQPLNYTRIYVIASLHRIKWRVIFQREQWRSGWWERMTRTVEDSQKTLPRKRCLTFEEPSISTCEVARLVACRPFPHFSRDHRELHPLEPSHFLIWNRIISLPPDHSTPGP